MDAQTIRWIAFDAVGTLIFPDPPVPTVYRRIGRKYGSRLSEAEIGRRFREAFRLSEQNDFDAARKVEWTRPDRFTTNEPREQQRWREIVAGVIDDALEAESCFQELFAYFAQPSAWTCYPDVAEALPALKKAGYRLAVASNFDRRLLAVCNGLPEFRPIERCVVSSVVGYRKPSLHFYRALGRTSRCRPEEILMVGDDERSDIQGARRAGLHALQIRRDASPTGSRQIANLRQLVERFT